MRKILPNPQFWRLIALIAVIMVSPLPASNFYSAKTVLAPFPVAAEAENEPSEMEYTVKKGDSLARIAVFYKVNLSDLRAWNLHLTNRVLQPGDIVKVKKMEYAATEGLASWYGPGFHGQAMANGQIYDMHEIVVAHRSLPLGRYVRVTNLENGRSIVAPVLDRGPYVKNGQGEYTREIDLSYAVALELGTVRKGVVLAKIEPIPEPWPAAPDR